MKKLFLLISLYCSLGGAVSHTLVNYHGVPGAREENRTPVVIGFVFACSRMDAEFKTVSTHVHKGGDITVVVLMEGCHATIFIENDSGDCMIDFFSANSKLSADKFKKFLDEFLVADSSKKLHLMRDQSFSFSA